MFSLDRILLLLTMVAGIEWNCQTTVMDFEKYREKLTGGSNLSQNGHCLLGGGGTVNNCKGLKYGVIR